MKVHSVKLAIKEYLDDQLIKNCSDYKQWFTISEWLFISADLLLKEHDKKLRQKGKLHIEYQNLMNIYFLIIGFAFENYFKGVIIKNLKTEKEIKNFLKVNCSSHELEYYYNKISVKKIKIGKDLLKNISIFVIWAGRYPVPKKSDKLITSFQLKDMHKSLDRKRVIGLIYDIKRSIKRGLRKIK